MNLRQLFLLCALALAVTIPAAAQAKAMSASKVRATAKIKTSESFYFLLSDYRMEHQGEANKLQLKIEYRYVAGISATQYPDFIPMRKTVDEFLTTYPNETTFWEIVNKELTLLLLANYPALASVTSELTVMPSPRYPFTRGSTVTSARRTARR